MDYISDIQKEKIMNALTEKRRIHTRGVRETGKKLSKIYGADAEKVDIACVFHDLYRGKNILELDKLVDEFAIDVKYKGNANLSHGKIAAKAAERDFGIKDREILDAISYHTTGRANMGLVEKIVFLSDAIEPGRDYPGSMVLRPSFSTAIRDHHSDHHSDHQMTTKLPPKRRWKLGKDRQGRLRGMGKPQVRRLPPQPWNCRICHETPSGSLIARRP